MLNAIFTRIQRWLTTNNVKNMISPKSSPNVSLIKKYSMLPMSIKCELALILTLYGMCIVEVVDRGLESRGVAALGYPVPVARLTGVGVGRHRVLIPAVASLPRLQSG